MKKVISKVHFFKYEADILFEDGTELIFCWDGSYDVSEEEITEWMNEHDIDSDSIEDYVIKFERYYRIENAD